MPVPPSLRSAAGQASLDAIAVVLVVAIVLGGATTVATDGAVAGAVVRGLHRALCVATGSAACPGSRLEACTTRSVDTSARVGAELALVRVGADVAVLLEERSDGTVDVSLLEGGAGGAALEAGAEGRITVGSRSWGAGALATAEVLARFDRRRTWRLPDRARADAFVRRVVETTAARRATGVPLVGGLAREVAGGLGVDVRRLPPADRERRRASLTGTVELDGAPVTLSGKAGVALSETLAGPGGRRRTLGMTLTGEAGSVLRVAAGGRGGLDASLAVEHDEDGRAVELSIAVAGRGALGVEGGPPARGALELREGQALELVTKLDLTLAENREAYRALLTALGTGSREAVSAASMGLARRLAIGGRMDVTRYATTHTGLGARGKLALGGKVGGDVGVARSRKRLVDAWSRAAQGPWERRSDCLSAS